MKFAANYSSGGGAHTKIINKKARTRPVAIFYPHIHLSAGQRHETNEKIDFASANLILMVRAEIAILLRPAKLYLALKASAINWPRARDKPA